MNIGSLIASIGGDMTPLQTSLKQAKAEMDKADQAMSQSMNNFSTSIKKAGDQMQKFGKMASLYLTVPLVAAGGYAIKMASDYEESINKVIGRIDGLKDKINELKKLRTENKQDADIFANNTKSIRDKIGRASCRERV